MCIWAGNGSAGAGLGRVCRRFKGGVCSRVRGLLAWARRWDQVVDARGRLQSPQVIARYD